MNRTIRARVVVPKQTWDGHLQLDVRIVPLVHRELAAVINASVERTQRPIMLELPDQLIVTQKQHASLNDYTEAMADTEDRMYVTPFNVMEVIVDREHADDREEVQSTIEILDELDEIIEQAESEAEHERTHTDGNNPGDRRPVPGAGKAR